MVIRALITILLLLVTAQAQVLAAPIPWRQTKVQFKAVDTPIARVLAQLVTSAGARVKVDPRVGGTVTLDLDTTPAGLLRGLELQFGFISYFDGSTLHITPVDSNTTAMLRLLGTTPERFEATLKRLQIADPRFPIRYDTSTGLAVVSGPPRYIELVREVARNARTSADPGQETIRVFPLRYATARDREIKSGSETTTIPGAATLMRAMYQGSDGNGASGMGGSMRASTAPKSTRRDSLGGPIDIPAPAHEKLEDLFSRQNLLGAAQTGGGLPQIQADPNQNAIVVRDRSDRMEAHQQLIRLLDVRPRLIELHLKIAEAETAVVNVFTPGPSVASAEPDRGTSIMTSDPTYSSEIRNERSRNTRFDPSKLTPPKSAEGQVRVIAEPRMIVLDNTVAEFSNLRSSSATGTARLPENVQLQSGLRLRITPQSMIDADGSRRIRLSVTVHDGFVATRDGRGEDSNTSHSFNTSAIVRSGESMMLGGMSFDYRRGPTRASRSNDVQGDAGSTNGRSERMYIITPRFVDEGSP